MAKKEHIVRFSVDELTAMMARGDDRTDWLRAATTTQAEIEAQIAADPDEAELDVDWARASIETPHTKTHPNIRVDADLLEFFQREGRGYQTKINAVLRAYVSQRQSQDRR